MPSRKNLDSAALLFYKWTKMADTLSDTRRKTLTTPEALVSAGLATAEDTPELRAVAEHYAMAITGHVTQLIATAEDPEPLARQFVPSTAELTTTPEERIDPIGDNAHSPKKGVVHRYPDRLLLKVHSACAVYCRFCFRREMVGPGGDTMGPDDLSTAFEYIRAHPEVWEVILTGGDPFVLAPQKIAGILDELDRIDHVQVVRIHTRVPVAAPDRITDALINVMKGRRCTVYVAVHTNHADELSADSVAACAQLSEAGIPLVGQSVLLKGVNDSAEALTALFRAMVRARIKPYYLNHPDLAPGTSHFRVPIETGQALMKALRGKISGLALPTYILDIPGGYGKIPIEEPYLTQRTGDTVIVEDVHGRSHHYPPNSDGSV